MIFAVYVRVRLREFPLERDEGEFAYAGQLLVQGVPPYKLAYNMKLPGTYIAYAALMAVFGQTIAGVHLGLLAVNLGTIVLLYRLARELFDPVSAGLAAIFFAITSVNPGVLGMAAHATHFVAFFGVAGVWMLWRYLQSGRWLPLVGSGLLLGTAFLMKQQGVFLMVFGGAVVATHAVVGFVKALRGRGDAGRNWLLLATQAAAFCGAAILPYLFVCLWLWRAGVFDNFWFWTYTYAHEYVAEVPLGNAWHQFWYGGEGINAIQSDIIAWLLALAGVAVMIVRAWKRPGRSLFVVGFFACSFLCVCPGFFFRVHYFIVALPAVSLLAGAACGELLHLAGLWKIRLTAAPSAAREPSGRRKKPLPKEEVRPAAPTFAPLTIPAALLVLAAIVWPFCDPSNTWRRLFCFEVPPELLCRVTYSGNPFVEAPAISHWLKEHMKEDDTLAVLGSEPEIPFYSHRHSATGYIYTYGLMEVKPSPDGVMKPQPLAETMQKAMIKEIDEKKPKYILLVDCRCSWLYYQNSCFLIYDWAKRYLRDNYDVVGLSERPPNPLQNFSPQWIESRRSETPEPRLIQNGKGETVLGWVGMFDGIQPNPAAFDCTVWVFRRKQR